MTTDASSFIHLPDADLLREVGRLAASEREATAALIAALAALDARRLYLGEGCSSLFTYCTQVLHLSEHAAYGRIQAARAARRFPVILELLADGALTLTTVGLLAPHLTEANRRELLDAARHRSKRDVERQVAALRPQAAVPATIRRLPDPRPAVAVAGHDGIRPPFCGSLLVNAGATAPSRQDSPAAVSSPDALPVPAARRPEVRPMAPEQYKVQFTVGRETHDKLRRVQDLLRHRYPAGDLALIFDRALTLLLAELARTKLGAATRSPRSVRSPGAGSRHIPAAVRRAVWARDDGRCAFVGTSGRCTERGQLEFHHVEPFAVGGEATMENVQLRCRTHNAYEAERVFARWSAD
jgi:hypothetical protein